MKKYDVLAIGSIYLDIYCIDFPITNGFKIETQTVGEKYTTSPGGSPVIFASAATKIGLKSVLIGKIGDDAIGQIVKKQLEKSKIKTDLIVDAQQSTNMSVNYINSLGKNLLTTVGNANQSLEPELLLPKIYQYLDHVSYLYLGSVFKLKQLQPYYIDIISAAKTKGITIVLDHGRATNVVTQEQITLVKEMLPSIDYYIPSKDEFLLTFHVETVEEGLKKVSRISDKTITIVTDAENTAIAMSKEHSLIYSESLKIHPVNTVGAGDTFNAGFIKALIDGMNLHDAINFAHRVAAYKISKNEYPSLQDVTK